MGLAWGYPEELGVELIDLAQETSPPGHDLAGLRRVRVVVSRGGPTCFGYHAGGIRIADQQAPQRVRGVSLARKPAPDSNDCQRFVASVCGERGHLASAFVRRQRRVGLINWAEVSMPVRRSSPR